MNQLHRPTLTVQCQLHTQHASLHITASRPHTTFVCATSHKTELLFPEPIMMVVFIMKAANEFINVMLRRMYLKCNAAQNVSQM
jgi:hypothetical protein